MIQRTLSSLCLLACFLTSCTVSMTSNSPDNKINPSSRTDKSWKLDFPEHWWQEIPRQDAKSWEVLPQDAGYKEVVLSKRNELGLLSNFAETPFVFHGVCYPTVEAFWQMMKYPEGEKDPRWFWIKNWKYKREQVAQMNGYSAKSAGNYVNFLMEKNNANWVTFEGKVIPFATKAPQEHYHLIWEALIEKLRQNPKVLEVILATKDLKLLPDHKVSEESPREWHYYLLWMDIRALLEAGQLSLQTQEDLSFKTCQAQNN